MKQWLFLILALVVAAPAAAQDAYPTKPVHFIVPFPPGGGTDTLARLLASKLDEVWGQPVVVENRPGAQGNIGTAEGAQAAPDGYTLTFAHQGALVINPHLYKSPGFDTLKDFAPVVRTTQMAFIGVASPTLPVKNLKDLARYAKEHPGQVTFASTSAGPHIVGELFKQSTGTDLMHVPYKGAAPALNDLLGGHVNVMFGNPTSLVPHIKAGKLQALGVMDTRRNPAIADVPTAQELGLPALSNVIEWYGIVVPAGTPKPIIDKIGADVIRVLDMPDVKDRLAKMGQTPSPAGAEEFGRMIRAEYERWGKVVSTAGIKAE
jgi:tripartite-type tricarboxylate transporter receptor subunit TctC